MRLTGYVSALVIIVGLVDLSLSASAKLNVAQFLVEHCPKACDGVRAFEFMVKHCSCTQQSKGVFRFGKRSRPMQLDDDDILSRILKEYRDI